MATEDPMHVMAASGIRGGLSMGDNVRSSAGAGISPSPVHESVAQELGMLLRTHSRLDSALSRRDMVPHRSGSAPPSVEGSLALMGGLLGGDPRGRLTSAGSGDNNDIIDSEQELRSDPAYLAYYYSHVNRNPRLPPPLVTRENYLLAQRLAVSGLGDKRKLRSFDDSNGRSLFSSQQTLPTHNEEPESSEDERSPMGNLLRHASDNWSERGALDGPPGFPNPFLGTKPKSLVDLIQEDFPRTPSPVFNQSCVSNDDGVNGAALTAASVAELSASLLGSRSATPSVVLASRSATPNPAVNSRSATPNPVLSSRSATPNPSIAHMIGNSGGASSVSSGPVARASTPDPSAADISGLPGSSNISLSQTKGMAGRNAAGSAELAAALQSLSLSNVPVEHQDSHLSVQPQQQATQFNQRPLGSQAQSQMPQSQIFAQALHHHQQQQQQLSGLESSHRAQGRYGLQNPQLQNSILQSGAANNAYAAAAAAMSYMAANPYYQNLQAYAPHYGVGGYPINPALIPALMANYPNPVAYDTAAAAAAAAAATLAAGMGPRAPISGSSNGMGFDMHPIYRYTGQAGASMQSYLQDPLYYQYLLQYSSSDSLELQRNYLNSMLGYPTEQKAELSRSGSVGVPAGGKSAAMNPLYYGNHGFVMPYTHSPISSPVLPGSPVATAPFSFRQAERNYRFAPGVGRTSAGGIHMGWHGQKGSDSGDESKGSSLLEELKNNKMRRFELADILGHVVEFSADQHGSRFIQQKLETVSLEEKASVFQEVLPHALTLMTDVFGNYVIQKFFEHGTVEQRSELADHLVGHVLNLSLQMYGCRVIQKALEVVDVEKQVRLVSELDGHVMRCVRDQNGNHVIQKCIECVPPEHINFIISAFYGQVVILSMHPYGCRVIQRVLEHCTDEQKQNGIMEEILSSVCTLAQDQYGNYVIQHILEHGEQRERSEILTKLAGQIVQMSQHKFASNVVEKCLEFGGPAERQILITEMLGQTDENEPLQAMMKDQYANYVVQKVLETCDDQQRELLLSRIKVHLHALKRYTYGKHIVARVEKLVATGERHGTQVL